MPASLNQLDTVFTSVIQVAFALVGVAVLVMLVIGGYQYLMAGGDKEAAARARGTLTYAVIGLILGASAWAILNLVGKFLGINFGSFSVCFIGGCS